PSQKMSPENPTRIHLSARTRLSSFSYRPHRPWTDFHLGTGRTFLAFVGQYLEHYRAVCRHSLSQRRVGGVPVEGRDVGPERAGGVLPLCLQEPAVGGH